jgi:transcriptional regulator with XRE-family HTH domain
MYNAQIVKQRIIDRADQLGISVRQVLISSGLHPNTVNQIRGNKQGLSSYALTALADTLECSIDYLLGREELLTPDQCVDIIDSIIAGKTKAELVAKYGGDLERNWHAMVVCAAMVKKEEALR